jgi:D-3-phosphoglycerate dehydrogenase / 2-oxoglutarate reductase
MAADTLGREGRSLGTPLRILCADGIAGRGLEVLRQAGEVDAVDGPLAGAELHARLAPCDAVVVRSGTNIDAAAIEAAPNLKVIARAGVGVDNIDVDAATAHGVVVVNSPGGNTIAAAEHAMAMLLAMARKIPAADALLRLGKWSRRGFLGRQLYQKTLGVIGCGKIGAEVVRRAQGFGMEVLVTDPYINPGRAKALGVRVVPLYELLRSSDFVTLHAPRTTDTDHLIGKRELSLMKEGAGLVNCARGGLVDEAALREALRAGKLSAAALDVFEKEPEPPTHLADLPNIILTPHLGASTEEAQEYVAVDVAEQIVDVLAGRLARSPVNVPSISAEAMRAVDPYLPLVSRMGRLHSRLLSGPIEVVEMRYAGVLAESDTRPLGLFFLVGLLSPLRSTPVNIVNAPMEARAWGIDVRETQGGPTHGYTSLVSATVQSHGRRVEVSGTVFGESDARIVELDGYRIDLAPRGTVLFIWHHDRPGVIGRVGTIMGSRNLNIAGMQVGRESIGGRAVMALMLDSPIDDVTLQAVGESADMTECLAVDFG